MEGTLPPPAPGDARERFRAAGQDHVFAFWDRLDAEGRRNLLRSAGAVNLARLARLARGEGLAAAPRSIEEAGPMVLTRTALGDDPRLRERAVAEGEELLRRCGVACVTLAGGQGTRLGWPGPKGCYPLGPGGRTLFEIHAAALAAAAARWGRPIPWVVLVSPSTDAATRAWFRDREIPGVPSASIRFVLQGTFPVLDDGGRLLLEAPDRIAVSPDGHGGLLPALRDSGTLAWLANLGVEHVSCFQVDNPLVPPLDPLFLGLHVLAGGQMSTKVFPKTDPAEKVGVVARVDGRLGVVEYSELPRELAEARDPSGRLRFGAGNMAAHVLTLPFVAAVAFRGLPIHRVRKKVPHLDGAGNPVLPEAPNAWKFETFLFDAMAHAATGALVEVDRDLEFAPVKNAAGPDSPATARALLERAGRWAP